MTSTTYRFQGGENTDQGIQFTDGVGITFGTDDDATWSWDESNKWMELVMGSAEYRFRGAYSQAGAASALVLNHMVPGAATLTGATGTTSLSTWFWANTAAANASSAITDLYYFDLPVPTASGTVTHAWSLYARGGVKFGSTIFPAAETQASAASDLNHNEITPSALTLSGSTTTTSVSLNRFKNTAVTNASATITSLYAGYFEHPTASGTYTLAASVTAETRNSRGDSSPDVAFGALSNVAYSNGQRWHYALAMGTAGFTHGGIATTNGGGGVRFLSIMPPLGGISGTTTGNLLWEGSSIIWAQSSFAMRADTEMSWGSTASQTSQATLAAGTLVSGIDWSTAQATSNTLVWGLGDTPKSLILCDYTDRNKDFDHAAQTNPTLFVHSATDPDTANTQWASLTHNQTDAVLGMGLGGLSLLPDHANGFALRILTIEESITIAAGEGAAGKASSTNLAPAGALILGVTGRVTTAPGGGATTFDLGVTAGDLDGFADNVSTALNTTFASLVNGNATAVVPLRNTAATTFTITTDSNVTGASMVVRIVVSYITMTAPTS